MDQWSKKSGTEVQRTNQPDSKKKKCTRGGRGKKANPISKIDDYVKHIFWEHNRDADHWANLGAEGQRKIVVDRRSNSETWKGGGRLLGW